MRRTRTVVFGALLVIMALGLAAGRSDAQTGPLPPGHPPLGGQRPSPSIPGPQPGSGAGSDGLTWTPPPGWVSEAPASSMRRAQYRIPGAAGPGECVVFYFGPGQGGDVAANVSRWASQFRRPDGSPMGDAVKTRNVVSHDVHVVLVEIVGTYVGGMGGGPSGPDRPNYMLLGAIAQGPDAHWFFRATGPRATLEAERAAFETMVRSIQRGKGLAKR